ncbi:glycoside hydrolase superfamily [Cadophora sp. MPI-SDFR-AT-0126]|nr:glycoside hydrolase superfamily [Leotiomycetes sp. MPI-SDFR-AT-0126]
MFLATDVVTSYSKSTGHDLPVDELKLPADFKWGVATAALQIEGGADQDGKGKSIWDTFSHLDPSRTNNENPDVSCNHYNLWEEDVELLSHLGTDVYRFSIAWSRIIPLGGRDDPRRNVEPVVTLYHWDAPQELYSRYKAFLNTEEFTADFENYARLCFSRFGDRVKKWITFNEPYIISIFGHHSGVLAPGHNKETRFDTKTEPWRVGHTLILSHAAAVKIYHRDKQADIDAAERRLIFYIGCSLRRNRELLRETAPLNAFLRHESLLDQETSENCDGIEIGPASGFQWLRVAPGGFRKLMKWVWNRYHLPIIVTENGFNDTFRQRYIGLYLDAISRAIYEDQVQVLGYYVWSLMDNFEWSAGYAPRYGIVHTDYTTSKRTPKDRLII